MPHWTTVTGSAGFAAAKTRKRSPVNREPGSGEATGDAKSPAPPPDLCLCELSDYAGPLATARPRLGQFRPSHGQ